MKTASLILFLLFAAIAKAEFPPRIAASERVVTLEQWGGRGNDALVWAVRPTEIVIYHVFSSTPDELLATFPIEPKLCDAIRAAVGKIKGPMRGKVWFDPDVFDGSMLRISFSPDGDLRQDRIEVANHWRPDFAELVELVSSACPEKWKVRFRERVAHLKKGDAKRISGAYP